MARFFCALNICNFSLFNRYKNITNKNKEIMAGRNYGTMSQGYYYDSSMTNICYNLEVNNGPYFADVAYHSKGQLIEQLVADGYKKEDMTLTRWDTNKANLREVEIK